jgi:hypothetical protein
MARIKPYSLSLLIHLWTWKPGVTGQNFSGDVALPPSVNSDIFPPLPTPLVSIGEQTKSVAFGTSEGYDVGGVAPLCWEALYSAIVHSSNTTTTNHLDELQEELFSLVDDNENPVSLLPSCYNGTSFTITEQGPTDTTETSEMYMLHAYTFRLQIQVDLPHIIAERSNDTTSLALPDQLKIYCRIQLCHTEKQGFCNPLVDTRALDQTVKKTDTDVGAVGDYLNTSSKWHYEQGTALWGMLNNISRDDGEALYTRWIEWSLKESLDTGVYNTTVDMTIQLPGGIRPGPYFVVGHVVLDLTENGTTHRIDLSQTIPDKVVNVRPEPKILNVSTNAKIWLSIAISVVGGFGLYCLIFVFWHRNSPVMKLAQGGLLGALAAACVLATVFSFSFLPMNDVFCKLRGPMVQVPLTFCGAILVGRVWRIYSALGAANSLGKLNHNNNRSAVEALFVKSLDCMAGFSICCQTAEGRRPSTSGFRRVVTARETYGLIGILTAPQIVLHVIIIFVTSGGLETEYDLSGTIGRVVCSSEGKWAFLVSAGITAFTYFLAVLMAWISRDLPSAFNEKDQIFNAATVGTILGLMALALGEITDQPTTKPDVSVCTDCPGFFCTVVAASHPTFC